MAGVIGLSAALRDAGCDSAAQKSGIELGFSPSRFLTVAQRWECNGRAVQSEAMPRKDLAGERDGRMSRRLDGDEMEMEMEMGEDMMRCDGMEEDIMRWDGREWLTRCDSDGDTINIDGENQQ